MHHPSMVAEPGTISVPVFFETVCPTLLAAWPEGHGGAVGFSIQGAERGEWILDLASCHVAPRGRGKGDLELAMTVESFARLMSGDLEIGGKGPANKLEAHGDVNLLLDLSDFLRSLPERRP